MLCLPFFCEVGIWSFLADEACLLKSPLGIGQLHKAGACTEARAFLMGPMLGKGDELESVEFGVLATSSNPAPVPAIPDAGTYITSSPSTIKGLYISTTCHELSCTALLNIDNLLHEAPISEFFFFNSAKIDKLGKSLIKSRLCFLILFQMTMAGVSPSQPHVTKNIGLAIASL